MLLILLSMLDTVQPASLVRPRYAVFGGSGFIGSRVCKALVEAGCSVASISRTGKCPAWATEEPWSAQVNWLAADMLSPPAQLAAELGAIDGAVSCVGNMRPSPMWRDFFGLHWDYESLTRENGLVTWRICESARAAGASRMVVLSVSSSKKWAFGGALMGYIDGKLEAEAAGRCLFGDEHVAVVGPSLVLGGGRFAGLLRPYAAICDSAPIRAQTRFFKALKSGASSGYAPQDTVNEVALTPPAAVDAVARTVCACLLETIPASRLASFKEQQRAEDQIRDLLKEREAAGACEEIATERSTEPRLWPRATTAPRAHSLHSDPVLAASHRSPSWQMTSCTSTAPTRSTAWRPIRELYRYSPRPSPLCASAAGRLRPVRCSVHPSASLST